MNKQHYTLLNSSKKQSNLPQPNNILTIANLIAEKLHIDKSALHDAIKKKFNNVETIKLNEELITKITQLLEADDSIQKFQNKLTELNKSDKIISNFYKLKIELGKLQLAFLIKKINKSNNCEDLLKAFMSALNGKLTIVNEILAESLSNPQQNSSSDFETISNLKGGGDISNCTNKKYYLLYVKYKLKNLEIIEALSTL